MHPRRPACLQRAPLRPRPAPARVFPPRSRSFKDRWRPGAGWQGCVGVFILSSRSGNGKSAAEATPMIVPGAPVRRPAGRRAVGARPAWCATGARANRSAPARRTPRGPGPRIRAAGDDSAQRDRSFQIAAIAIALPRDVARGGARRLPVARRPARGPTVPMNVRSERCCGRAGPSPAGQSLAKLGHCIAVKWAMRQLRKLF